jgi:hypothetical protein
MVENSRNPRLVNAICVLGVTIPSVIGILVLGRKFIAARARIQEGPSEAD